MSLQTEELSETIKGIDDRLRSLENTRQPEVDDWHEFPSTYFSYLSGTVISVSDIVATDFFQRGDRVRWVQASGTKYGYITSLSTTSITVQGGDFSIANETITSLARSRVMTPSGMAESLDYTAVLSLDAGSASITNQDFEFMIIGNVLVLSINVAIGVTSGGNPTRYSFTLPLDYLKVPPATLPSATFDIPVYYKDQGGADRLAHIIIDSDNPGRFDLTLDNGAAFTLQTLFTLSTSFAVAYI